VAQNNGRTKEMKVKINVELETDTGVYEIKFTSEDGQTMDQQELVRLLRKVIEKWNQKFVD
jgi:hypothetical protein